MRARALRSKHFLRNIRRGSNSGVPGHQGQFRGPRLWIGAGVAVVAVAWYAFRPGSAIIARHQIRPRLARLVISAVSPNVQGGMRSLRFTWFIRDPNFGV